MRSRHTGAGAFGYWFAAICLASAVASGQAPAASGAPSADSYEAMVKEAVADFAAGEYLKARVLFMRAHELKSSARTLRGLGLVEFELGRYAEAMRLLRRALVDIRNPLTDAQRQEAEALLAKGAAFVGRYRVVLEPASAKLNADGTDIELADVDLVLDAGSHRLTARAPGYRDATQQLQVKGGESQSLRFVLVPIGARAAPVVAAPVIAPPVGAPVRAPLRTPPAPAQEPAFWESASTWGWVAAGGAALSLTGGLVARSRASTAAERWNSEACLEGGGTREQNCSEHREAVESGELWSVIGFAGAGALAATAVVLLVSDSSSASDAQPQPLACASAADLGVACLLRF